MNYSQFSSNQGWVSFNYPSNMITMEEDEGTYLFYTEQTGSFRVTPIKLDEKGNFDADKYLIDLSIEHNGQILKNLNHKYVFYLSYSEDNEDALTIFNWIFVVNDKIVYCSYTIDSDGIDDPEILTEKNEILKIIEKFHIK